ncbi:FG-GAP repeat protein [Sphingorhabdus sp. Alg239-R122]|uniref:FG-GAP repeat protein n=1 Tax=Sphingorhabdus sp. Alg239-R122 TaxID=2305989 RepID=UPI0013DC5993|nr:FG-GAP repeat protein [Sphingorhabdus sp. Alg239-R122]
MQLTTELLLLSATLSVLATEADAIEANVSEAITINPNREARHSGGRHCPILPSLASADASSPPTQHKILSSDGASEDFFGFSVAISGDTAIAGAFRADDEIKGLDAGAAYIFSRTGNVWQPRAKLTALDGRANDTLGGNVAIWGDTAVVGAIGHDGNGNNAGAAYVFERSGDAWQQQAKLMASDGDADDAFGQNVAIFGDRIVIGAPHDDDKGDGSGSVYVFTRNGENWEQQAKLTARDGLTGDLFGISVALTHDTILVGADLHDERATNAGAAYVFVQSGNKWVQQAKLTAADGAETDIFGVRVALSGDTALISARRDDDKVMGVDAGSAYVFTRRGTTWHQQAKLVAPDGDVDDRFGRDVALNKDTALIGAMHQDDRGDNSGAAYVFKRAGTSWTLLTKLTAHDGASGDLLGWSVAMSHNNALIAAVRNDDHGNESGAAYIFDFDDQNLPTIPCNIEKGMTPND